MTTPDADDAAPYLPPSQPTPPSPPPPPVPTDESPTLPTAPPPDAPAAEPAAFDARAMVESMKHHKESALYGGLPTATPESRAAAQALRQEARRKRKRNKRLGWFVALIFLVIVAVAGFLAYREYRADQDRRQSESTPTVVTPDDDPGSGVAPGPLGEQLEVLNGSDAVLDAPATGTGGLTDIIDRAETVVSVVSESP